MFDRQSWEHDARIRDYSDTQSLYTIFADNNGFPITRHPSVALGLIIEKVPNKNSPPKIYSHLVDSNDHVFSYAEGSYQRLEDGNSFVGYGVRPVLKEFGPFESGGDVRWTADFGYRNNNNTAQSYRAWKHEWCATPTDLVSLVVEKATSNDTLSQCAGSSQYRGYVSWNGATDVIKYNVYAGKTESTLESIGFVAKKGFETEFVVPSDARFVQVAAIERGMRGESGSSNVVAVS